MAQNVMITGTGRGGALGFNLVKRYLEQGDLVFATIRKPSEALEELKKEYPETLKILTMDISCSDSVKGAQKSVAEVTDHLDLIINNAVTVSPDFNKSVLETDPDLIPAVVNVGAMGALRVIQTFYPMLKKSSQTALIVNISSEAGSIGALYRKNMVDYAIEKAAVNVITKTLWNEFADDPQMNIICIHPGWVRTNEGNALAPLEPYAHAETLRLLFEKRRNIKDGDLFLTYEEKVYPW